MAQSPQFLSQLLRYCVFVVTGKNSQRNSVQTVLVVTPMATCLNTDANAGCPSSAGGGGGGGTGNESLLWKSNSGESGGDGGDGAGDTGCSSAHMTTGIPWRESAPPVGALPWRGADDPVPPVASAAGIASSTCRGGSVGGGGGGNGSGMEVMEVSKVRPMNNGVSMPAAMSPAGVPFEAAVTGRSRGMVSAPSSNAFVGLQ